MDVYRERAHLTSLLSKLFPASIEEHEGEDWDDEWRNVLIIDTPCGQLSWHIAESDLDLFRHLPYKQGIRKWDGHSTEEKYERIKRLGEPLLPRS